MTAALILKPHEKDIGGGFIVRRVLPSALRQTIGPFIFFDHFGPLDVAPEANQDVRPHPHIGLATVTYLYEGAIMHRDSVGSVQRIEPGAINWMTAGRGIVHSERTPEDLIGKPRRSHGLQLWIALPKAHEDTAPGFEHTAASAIPSVAQDGALVRVLIGSAFGLTSPVTSFSETLYLDVALEAGKEIALTDLPAQIGIYAVMGEIAIDGVALAPFSMAYVENGAARVSSSAGAQFVVVGGEPIDGPRYLFWNFVASSRERLSQAAEDWTAQRFDPVPGETEFIPLPKTMRVAT